MFFKKIIGAFYGTFVMLSSQTQFGQTAPQHPAEDPAHWLEPVVPLREIAEQRGMYLGVAVNHRELADNPAYRETIAREFNMVVAENVMKWQSLQPRRGEWTFEHAEAMVDFAEAQGMRVRGHTLIWHGGLPAWLRNPDEDWDAEELRELMLEHIRTVVGHFRGRVHDWDVVNEAITPLWRDPLRPTMWRKVLGPGYIADAFRAAHEADPDARLFYNEFMAEDLGRKSKRTYQLLQALLAEGVPVHGVGLQTHLHFGQPAPEDFRANLRRLSKLGLVVQLTELDAGVPRPVSQRRLAKQAVHVWRVTDACLHEPACDAIVLWGLDDGTSWIPKFFRNWDAPLLFDADLRPKLAYYGLANALAGRRP